MSARTDITFQDWIGVNINNIEEADLMINLLKEKRTSLINTAFSYACDQLKPGELLISNVAERRTNPSKIGSFLSLFHYKPQTPFTSTTIDLSDPVLDIPIDWTFHASKIILDSWIKKIIKVIHTKKDELFTHEFDVYYPLCTLDTFSKPGLYFYIIDFDYQSVSAFLHDTNGRYYHCNVYKNRVDRISDFDPAEDLDLELLCLLKFEEYIESSQKKQRTE